MATLNIEASSFDIKTLSEILGHSSVQITLDRYVHSSFEHKLSLEKAELFAEIDILPEGSKTGTQRMDSLRGNGLTVY